MTLLQETTHFYQEYSTESFVIQPWNTISSLFFFVPLVYFGWKFNWQFGRHKELLTVLIFVCLNGLGSTLFHGFNGGLAFMLLDAVPPFVMLLFLSTYFWKLSINSWIYAVLIVLGFLAINFSVIWYLVSTDSMPRQPNLIYFLNGVMAAAPIIWLLIKTRYEGWMLILSTILLIGLALYFRIVDKSETYTQFLDQGTHFLWHVFSVLSIFPLARFMIQLKATEVEKES